MIISLLLNSIQTNATGHLDKTFYPKESGFQRYGSIDIKGSTCTYRD